jgi:hypothetical protein
LAVHQLFSFAPAMGFDQAGDNITPAHFLCAGG